MTKVPANIVGRVFDTAVERGCVATTEPDALGNFDALDSDNVLCSFSLVMVERWGDAPVICDGVNADLDIDI